MSTLKRFTKTEELIGLEFDGTEESAKGIVEWIKSIVGDQYQRGQMQRGIAKSNLGYDGNEWFRPEAVLRISLKDLPETYAINAPAGSYIVYDPNELEVRFRTTGPYHLATFRREDINVDLSKD